MWAMHGSNLRHVCPLQVEGGLFNEAGVTEKLMEPGKIPGNSGTRNLPDNLSDLKAQVNCNLHSRLPWISLTSCPKIILPTRNRPNHEALLSDWLITSESHDLNNDF